MLQIPCRSLLVLALGLSLTITAAGCSPGSLPGSPSPMPAIGGAARYDGTLIYQRLAGGFQVDTAPRPLNMSVVLGTGDQMSGRFVAGETAGTLQASLDGTMSSGRFQGTILVSTPASAGGASSVCEGVGSISGSFVGPNLTWSATELRYENCPGLVVGSQAQAVAVSPVPGSFGGTASVIVSILPSPLVSAGVCPAGGPGWPFTVVAAENAGIDVRLNSTFEVEERPASGTPTRSIVDTPFAVLSGGSRREYQVCAGAAGTYQAFFSGTDTRGNRVRFASPLVTMLP